MRTEWVDLGGEETILAGLADVGALGRVTVDVEEVRPLD